MPLPPQTMQGTLAPSGFLPDPEQNTHLICGSSVSTAPDPLQTWQLETGESKSNGSFPVPLQKAQVVFFNMAGILCFNRNAKPDTSASSLVAWYPTLH
jgi:hypothetical protein